MAKGDFLDHIGSDNSTLGDRVTASGYGWSSIAENILVRNDLSVAGAFDQWFNSPDHKANMLKDDVSEIGITVACTTPASGTPKYYFTMVLARG